MKGRLAFIPVLAVAALLAGSGRVSAQGFGVYEQSACMTGRGGAGVASPCSDASAIFFNPAGLSFDEVQVGLGAGVIGPRGDFTNASTQLVTDLNKKWYPVPNIFASAPIGRRVAVGVGVFAPYGLTTDWPVGSEGRFLGYKSLVQGVYLQPTIAVKLNDRITVGGGVDITYLNVELRQRVDLASQTLLVHPVLGEVTFGQLNLLCPAAVCGSVPAGTDFANVDLTGHAWHAGGHLGVIAKATDRLSFGARWMMGQRIEVSNGEIETTQISVPGVRIPMTTPAGTVLVPVDTVLAGQFASGGSLATGQSATTSLPMPDQVVVGGAFQAAKNLKLFLDYQFTRWSMFDRLEIVGQTPGLGTTGTVESYKDTHGIRIGAEANVHPMAVVRVGFDGHGAAAPDQTVTPNLPEGPRQEYTAGVGLNVTGAARLDFGYMYLHQQSRAGRTTNGGKEYPEPVPVSANNGTYSFKAHIFNAMLSIRF